MLDFIAAIEFVAVMLTPCLMMAICWRQRRPIPTKSPDLSDPFERHKPL
jgi:hypothetical protein